MDWPGRLRRGGGCRPWAVAWQDREGRAMGAEGRRAPGVGRRPPGMDVGSPGRGGRAIGAEEAGIGRRAAGSDAGRWVEWVFMYYLSRPRCRPTGGVASLGLAEGGLQAEGRRGVYCTS